MKKALDSLSNTGWMWYGRVLQLKINTQNNFPYLKNQHYMLAFGMQGSLGYALLMRFFQHFIQVQLFLPLRRPTHPQWNQVHFRMREQELLKCTSRTHWAMKNLSKSCDSQFFQTFSTYDLPYEKKFVQEPPSCYPSCDFTLQLKQKKSFQTLKMLYDDALK